MSLYTSTSHSTPIVLDLYDVQLCSYCVTYYTDHFLKGFQIPDIPSKCILIEDKLRATYRRFYHLGAGQVEVSIDETYQYNVNLLAAALDSQEAQRLCGGARNAAKNLEIDAIIHQPEDNDRNDCFLHREAQCNAAPGGDPGDDDDDDNDDWVPGNNNPGGPGGDDDDDIDGDEDDTDDGHKDLGPMNSVPIASVATLVTLYFCYQ